MVDYNYGATENEQAASDSASQQVFPSDLGTIGHYVVFAIFPYSRANRMDPSARVGQYKGYIYLPMPSHFGVDYGADYQNASLGFIGFSVAEGGDTAQKVFNAYNKADGSTASVAEISKLVREGLGGIWKNAPGLLAGAMLDELGPISDGASVSLGLSRNPHLAVLYKNPKLRQHVFQYRFVPRSEAETQALTSIIKAFKTAQHPEFGPMQNHLFRYPDEFQIELSHPEHMFTFGPCVLLDIKVDYHDTGTAAYFETTKAPVAIGLQLVFQETTIVTREDVVSRGR